MMNILGFTFSEMNMEQTVHHLDKVMDEQNQWYHVVTANPEIVMNGLKDSTLYTILNDASLITPDGIGIVIASKIFGKPLTERVTGFDLFNQLLSFRSFNEKKTKVFMLGAEENILKKAILKLKEQYPHCEIVGHHHGFFKEDSDTENMIIEEIKMSKPDLLLVGLGSPKQDYFIHKLSKQDLPLMAMGVGGSFDVLGDKVKRAPILFQKIGMEWFYRLIQQPSRLKRQFILFHFMMYVLKKRLLNR